MTKVVQSRADFLAARGELPGAVGLVPTMGALHAGHAALLKAARAGSKSVVATVFVNPLQFGPGEDLDRYPRDLDADLAICEQAGVDLLWAPAVGDVYAAGRVQVSIAAGPLGDIMEGEVRPGHFDGVLTVVAKLFNLARPELAFFGEKDYQQLTLIRRMVADLDLAVEVVAVPTAREPDGLALSSRNRYLSAADRADAVVLSGALEAGRRSPDPLAAARAVLDGSPRGEGPHIDYLELRGVDLGEPPVAGPARLLVAGRFGTTRLIDNVPVTLPELT